MGRSLFGSKQKTNQVATCNTKVAVMGNEDTEEIVPNIENNNDEVNALFF